MANRTVSVKLLLESQGYMQGVDAATKKTREMGSEAEKLALQKESFNTLGVAAVGLGAAVGVGVGAAVMAFANFDQAMSSVQAATHETAGNMDLLRQAALDAGESTVFSATEAANAIEELSKAGVSTADILGGGLTGALDLAAAGELGVAEAAGIAATSLKMFNLEGDDMSHVADLLAAGAGKAMGDVGDLSQALNQAGLVANQTGLSIEETTAGLAAFAEQGLLGSDAGTSFKSMLQRLTPQSSEAANLMKDLGISAYDASGNFVGLAEFAGNLQGALKNLTPEQRNSAMATIFGSDAVRAANVIYNQGEQGIRDWTAAVDDQGYASQTAALRLDNLKGDIEALGGAIETGLIQTGSAANDTLRTMTQALTGLVGMYNDLPEGVQATVTVLGAATGVVALSGGAALLAVPKWAEFKRAVEGTSWSMKGMTSAIGIAGLAVGAGIAVVGALAAAHQRAEQKAQSYADTLEEGTQRVTDATRDLIAENLTVDQSFLWASQGSLADNAETLGLSIDTVTDAIEGNSAAWDEVNAAIQRGINEGYKPSKDANLELYDAAVLLQGGLEGEVGALDKAAEKARQKEEATKNSAEASETAAESYLAEADAVEDLSSQMLELIDTINAANGISQSAIDANANYQSALAGISEEIQNQKDAYEESNGTLDGFRASLDQATESGSANAAMLADVAGAAQDAAAAQFEQDQATMSADEAATKYYDTLVAQREAFINSATAAGFSADEVQALADKVFALPTEREIQMLVETAEAQNKIDRLVINNNGRRITITADVNYQAAGGITVTPGYSTGGPVRGPGSATSDSILARLSDGEHVLTAAEVQAMGGHDAVEDWRSMAISGAAAGYTPDGPEMVITIARKKETTDMLTRYMNKHKELSR